MIIIYTACILNYTHKIAVLIFFGLLVGLRYLSSCCQRSVAVVKAVAELKIESFLAVARC